MPFATEIASLTSIGAVLPHHDTLDALAWGTAQLRDAGIDQAEKDARYLLEALLGVESLYKNHAPMEATQRAKYKFWIMRRLQHEPVSKIVGKKDFWKYSFITNRATLDPRPDSEVLIEALLTYRPDLSQSYEILDLGTGSGCLLLSALGEYSHAVGTGVDISPEALQVAKQNTEILGFLPRTKFIESDWCMQLDKCYDIVLCNPPYIAQADRLLLMPEVSEYDPPCALYGGEDGLQAYRMLLPDIMEHVKSGALLILELGINQQKPVSHMAQGLGYRVIACHEDLGGVPRALVLEATEETEQLAEQMSRID